MLLAELAIAAHEATTDPRQHLETALTHAEAALTVFDPEHMSYNYEKAISLRDKLKEWLKELG